MQGEPQTRVLSLNTGSITIALLKLVVVRFECSVVLCCFILLMSLLFGRSSEKIDTRGTSRMIALHLWMEWTSPFSGRKFHSHKFKLGSALRYEVGVAVVSGALFRSMARTSQGYGMTLPSFEMHR